jgi:Cofilin/tropomyosin-type actin-binding protein
VRWRPFPHSLKTRHWQVLFVYSCPEAAPVRAKMTYSTARASVVAAVAAAGVSDPKVSLLLA